jgi:hypothetical protein
MEAKLKTDKARRTSIFCNETDDYDIIKVEDQNANHDHFSSKYIERNCIMSRKRPTADWQTVLRQERMRRALKELAKFCGRRCAEEQFNKDQEKESLLSKQRRKKIRELRQDKNKD